MKNLAKQVLFWIAVLAISLLPFIWLREGYVYMSEEDNFGNFKNVVYRNTASWTPSVNKGNAVLPNDHIVIMPAGIMYNIFSESGISLDLTQKIYLSVFIFITILSVIYALRLFVSDKLILLTGAIFYYCNFYVKSTTFYSAKMYQLILMPLFFAFLYRYLESKKYIYVALNFIFFFVFQSIFTNLPTFLATIIFYPSAIAFHYIKKEMGFSEYVKKHSKLIVQFFLPTIPIFFYNILVYYFSYISSNTYSAIKQAHTFSAITAPLSAILQFRGAWWETAGFEGVSYNPWLWFYDNPIIVAGSFILIGSIAYIGIYKKAVSRTYFFWFFMFIIGVLLASGSSLYQPIFKWFFINIPLFYIFREPWAKFMPIVIFAATVILALTLRDIKKKYIIYGALLLIIVRGIPFFSPDFFDYNSKRGFTPFAKIPSYWKEFEQWTTKNREATLLSIPIDYFLRNWYKDDLGNINHPLARLFGYSNMIYESGNNNFGIMLHYFVSQQNPAFIKVASLDYAFKQNDVDLRYYPEKSKDFSQLLSQYFHEEPSNNFGDKLFLHRIKPEYVLPTIYIPSTSIVTGGLGGFASILSSYDYKMGTAVFLKSQNRDKTYILNTNISQSTNKQHIGSVQFSKIDTTKYAVTLKNVSGVTPLLFNQNYHPKWELHTGNTSTSNLPYFMQYFFPKKISDSHFTANGYANAWFIDVSTVCTHYIPCIRNNNGTYSFDAVIEYVPNRYFTVGLIFFAFTSVGILIIVLGSQIRKKI